MFFIGSNIYQQTAASIFNIVIRIKPVNFYYYYYYYYYYHQFISAWLVTCSTSNTTILTPKLTPKMLQYKNAKVNVT